MLQRPCTQSTLALAIVLCAGLPSALAQPVVDGVKDDAYGAPKWVNLNATGFGNNGDIPDPCNPNLPGGDPAAVTTGVEFGVPVSSLGGLALGASVKVMAAINGGGNDFFSNQFLPSLPAGSGNLGEPRNVNLSTIAGDQFAQFVPAVVSVAPSLNGSLAGDGYGAAIALQLNRTGFGNATNGSATAGNGSELDGMYCVRFDNGTPGDATDDVLYFCFTGNVESNFNKLNVFFDTIAGAGQNRLLGNNSGADFGALNRMGDSGTGNGLTFDADFTPDYIVWGGNGGDTPTFFPNYAELLDGGNGLGAFQGCYVNGAPGGQSNCGNQANLAGWNCDNSNTAGVAATCPPPPPPPSDRDAATGSEIDAVYSVLDTVNNRLYIMVTGNLQNEDTSPTGNGGNKIMLFVDAQSGGQNRMRGDNVDISFGNLNRLGDDGSGNGLTWDTGFSPDYWVQYKNVGPNNAVVHVMDSAVLRSDGRRIVPFLGGSLDYGAYFGGPKSDSRYRPARYDGNSFVAGAGFLDPNDQDGSVANIYTNFAARSTGDSLVVGQVPPFAPPFNAPVGVGGKLIFDMDNGNTGGVSGTSGAGGENATKGLEISIDLAELGWDGTSAILLGGFVINNDGTFLSNQVIGGLPAGSGNLGGNVRGLNFNNIAGTQHISLVSGPSACSLDLNGDGNVDPDDLSDAISRFFDTTVTFDYDNNGFEDPDDLSTYISDYFTLPLPPGC